MERSGPTDLERLKALYQEWATGDYSRGELFDPALQAEGFGMGEPIKAKSLDEFVAVMRKWLSAWERPLRIDAEEFIQSGDRILVLVHWAGRGKGSGAEIEGRGAHLWTFKEGLVTGFEAYRDREEARAAFDRE